MRKLRLHAIIVLVALAGARVVSGAPLDIPAGERAALAKRLRTDTLPSLQDAKRTHVFADGAIGYVIGKPTNDIPELPLSPQFANRGDQFLFMRLCQSSAIVRATALDFKSFLTPDRRSIFTRTTFQPKELIYSDSAGSSYALPSKTFTVVMRGGELEDSGQVYRVVNQGAPLYVRGQDYIIFVLKPFSARQPVTTDIRNDPSRITVRNEVIKAESPLGPLHSDMTYDGFKSEILRIKKLSSCPVNG